MEKTKVKGGKREGAGRPLAPATAVMRLRLPIDTHRAAEALGGAVWAKRLIDEAIKEARIKVEPGSSLST